MLQNVATLVYFQSDISKDKIIINEISIPLHPPFLSQLWAGCASSILLKPCFHLSHQGQCHICAHLGGPPAVLCQHWSWDRRKVCLMWTLILIEPSSALAYSYYSENLNLIFITHEGSNPRTVHPNSLAMASSKLQSSEMLWRGMATCNGFFKKHGPLANESTHPREYTKQPLWIANGPAKQTFHPPSYMLPNLFAIAQVAVCCSKYLREERGEMDSLTYWTESCAYTFSLIIWG